MLIFLSAGLAENRTNYEDTLEKCRQELEDDICVTAIFLERVRSSIFENYEIYGNFKIFVENIAEF